MDRARATALYERYTGAVACVESVSAEGDPAIGTAFHIGDGLFVTARHVVERGVTSLRTTTESRITYRSSFGVEQVDLLHEAGLATDIKPPLYHPDDDIDVAVIETNGIDAPAVPIEPPPGKGGEKLVLEQVLVMGYPRIPLAADPPTQLVVTAEINAVTELYVGKQPTIVLSSTARGGFSGGLVLSEDGVVVGVIARSLVEDTEPVQLGFLSAIGVEAIVACLGVHSLGGYQP